MPALVLIAAALPFLPILGYGFLNWDDPDVFVRNTQLLGSGWPAWAFTTSHMGHYQPLSWLAWASVARTVGVTPTAMHALSLGVHLLDAVLVYVLASRLARAADASAPVRMWAPAASALLFAVHPLKVEPVAWASAFPYLLALALALISAVAYVRAHAHNALRNVSLSRAWLTASIAAYALSLLARPVALGFPVVLFVIDAYPLRRLPLAGRTLINRARGPTPTRCGSTRFARSPRPQALGSGTAAHGSVPGLKTGPTQDHFTGTKGWHAALIVEKIPFVVLAIAAGWLEASSRTVAGLEEISLATRVGLAAGAPFVYVLRTVWPFQLSPLDVIPIAPDVSWWRIVGILAALAGAALVVLRAGRRAAPLSAATIAYVALLAPAAGLAPSGLQASADRYAYMPAVPLALALGAGLATLFGKRRVRVAAAVAVLIVGTALAHSTAEQVRWWRDSVTLWTRTAALDPQNDVARYNLASALAEAGRLDEAMSAYEETLRLVPDHNLARTNLARLRAAKLEEQAGQLAAAGRMDEAIARYSDALALDPARRHSRASRGVARLQVGDVNGAASDLREVWREGDRSADVANALGLALIQTGAHREAASVLREGASAYPADVNIAHNLARLLATSDDARVRNGDEAVRLAERVNRDTGGRDPRALDTLAAAYMAAGKSDLAKATRARAIEAAMAIGDAEMAAQIRMGGRR